MPRMKSEINHESALRIKELLDDNDMKQKELAEKLHYSEQHISLILTGKRPLPVETAKEIARLFPPVRFEWIMGYDNFRTPTEYAEVPFAKKAADKQFAKQAVSMLAATSGYKFEVEGTSGCAISPEDVFGMTKEGREFLEKHITEIRGDCVYAILLNGEKKGEINIDGFNQIVSEIRDFAEFKLSRLCKGGVDCGKHSREKE